MTTSIYRYEVQGSSPDGVYYLSVLIHCASRELWLVVKDGDAMSVKKRPLRHLEIVSQSGLGVSLSGGSYELNLTFTCLAKMAHFIALMKSLKKPSPMPSNTNNKVVDRRPSISEPIIPAASYPFERRSIFSTPIVPSQSSTPNTCQTTRCKRVSLPVSERLSGASKRIKTEDSQVMVRVAKNSPTNENQSAPLFRSSSDVRQTTYQNRCLSLPPSNCSSELSQSQLQRRRMSLATIHKFNSTSPVRFSKIGNSCYIAAILSALFSIESFVQQLEIFAQTLRKALIFRNAIKFGNYPEIPDSINIPGNGLFSEFVLLAVNFQARHRGSSETGELGSVDCRVTNVFNLKNEITRQHPLLANFHQQDAHEFLTLLLGVLEASLIKQFRVLLEGHQVDQNGKQKVDEARLKIRKELESLEAQLGLRVETECDSGEFASMPRVFNNDEELKLIPPSFRFTSGEFVSVLVCEKCYYESARSRPFRVLSVKLPFLEDKTKCVSLIEMLKQTARETSIEFRCGQTRCDGKFVKFRQLIQKCPEILILHVNRVSNLGERINQQMFIPLSVNLANIMYRCNPSKMYQLRAVVCHIEGRMKRGHFYTYVRNVIPNSTGSDNTDTNQPSNESHWYRHNDSIVQHVSKTKVVFDIRHNAHLILYESVGQANV